MTITSRIHEELFTPVVAPAPGDEGGAPRLLIRMPLSHPRGGAPDESSRTKRRRQRRRRSVVADPNHLALAWTAEEHERFLRGLELFPRGPWKDVAHYVGTRTVRQTMTHAQKYRQKIARHKRGLLADANKKTASSTAATPPAAAAESTESATPSPMLSVSVLSTDEPESTATYANLTPTACAPGFQPIYSPSSMEEFAFDMRRTPSEDMCWQGLVPAATNSLAPFSPPTTPYEPSQFAMPFTTTTAPAPYDDGNFDFPLDDAELDALAIDDVIHSVISQYLGPCPTDGGDFPATASWSFVGLP